MLQKPFKIIVTEVLGQPKVIFDMHPVGESCQINANAFKSVMQKLGVVEQDDYKNDRNDTNVAVLE